MAVEFLLFALLAGIGAASCAAGFVSKSSLFVFIGCALLIGSGAVLWGGEGLIVGHYYDVAGLIQSTVIPITDVGLSMLAFALVSFGVLGGFIVAFNSTTSSTQKTPTFHY
jgi:hypothetical protein